MSGVDLSVLVPLRDESVTAGPTFRSLEAALAPLAQRGIRVERLIALDRATAAARAFADQPDLAHWTRIDLPPGEPAVSHAAGRLVTICPAGDLVSETWLTGALACLDRDARAIVHPELIWEFDARTGIYALPDHDDPFFSPHARAAARKRDLHCVAPRAAWTDQGGSPPTDRGWIRRTLEAGWHHRIARDTIAFRRCRDRPPTPDPDCT